MEKDEDVYDFPKQFRNMEQILAGFNEENIHLFASLILRGNAGILYDELEKERKNLGDLIDIMISKYGRVKNDRPTEFKNFLDRFQEMNETLYAFFRACT